MKIQIKNRFTNAVLFEAEVPDNDPRPMLTALEKAVAAGADLADANLAGAYLADAYLAGAYLADAYLAGADLAGANLAGADLAGAYLADAYLAGADLAGADLAGANLAGADLAGAYLADAYLADARDVPAGIERKDPETPYVRPTTPAARAQRLDEHARRFRERHPDVPVVPQLDKRLLEIIDGGRGALEMSTWHSSPDGSACGTTHCRAGWAIMLAGEAGKALEEQYGPERAGAMIYRASTGRVPYFFGSNESALADIKRCAAEQGEVEP